MNKKKGGVLLCALLLVLTACGRNGQISETEYHHTANAAGQHHAGSGETEHHAAQEPALQGPAGSAQAIREQLGQGASAGEWLPLLMDVSWGDLDVPGDETDWIMAALESVHRYVAEAEAPLPEDTYRILLSCTGGLDGAYAEGYAGTLYSLYVQHPTRFASITLDGLSPEQRGQILELLLYDWGYYHNLDSSLPYEEQMAILTCRLEEDKRGALGASPDVMLLWYEGQSARFLPVNTDGIYAVSYTSDHPEVAAVDDADGTVTAVGPGDAVIILHYEGNATAQDFTCAVHCAW